MRGEPGDVARLAPDDRGRQQPAARDGEQGQFRTAVVRDSATLIELAAADAAERAAAREGEPDVPASIARHLSAPMSAAGGPIAYLPDEPAAG